MSEQQQVRLDNAQKAITPLGSVEHNVDLHRFELGTGGVAYAFLSYNREGNCLFVDHTFVPKNLRGRGIAAKLARAALEEARQQGWKVVPRCAYVASFIEQHPEFAELVAHQQRRVA